MVKIYDVNQDELVKQIATDLEKEGKIKAPEWTVFVKTGSNKERPPLQKNWWYLRLASILRKVAIDGPIGVSKLRTKYGSKKNRGVRPEKFVKSGGKIIRVALQQLEQSGYVYNEQKTKFKGRKITPSGMSLIDKSSGVIFKKVEKTTIKEDKPKKEKSVTETQPEKVKEEVLEKVE
jgi:small subunit ribosomal protein S19e